MKRPFTLTFFAFLIFATTSFSQSTITQLELQSISKQLVNRLNNKNFDGKLLTLNFTNQQGKESELGAFLSNLFSNQLVNSNGMFIVLDREETLKAGNGGKFISAIGDLAGDIATDLSGDQTIGKAANRSVEVLGNPANSKDKRLKGVDVIVYGTVTTLGDQYFLEVKAKDRKKDHVLATASGQISNTDALARLNGSLLPEPVPIDPGGSDNSSASQTFERMHLRFELIKCVQGTRYLECHVRITSTNKDSEITIYPNETRIFNQNGGTEFGPIGLAIADVNSTSWVRKGIIKDTPVIAVLTFEPNEDIRVISKLVIQSHEAGIGYFFADFPDIFVD